MNLRLYLDEDSMDQALVQALRARGVDVETALDAGMIERTDDDHSKYSTGAGRALYSLNAADFYRLHTHFIEQGLTHVGVVLAQQQRYAVGEQLRRLLTLVANRTAEEMKNRVEFLTSWGQGQWV